MERSEALALIAVLEAAYEHELPEPTLMLWSQALEPFDYAVVALAVNERILSSERFMPRIGEVVTAAHVASMPSVQEAWLEVLGQIRAVGSGDKPTFSHPAIQRAVDVAEWDVLCASSPTQPWTRKDFEKIYEGVRVGVARVAALPASSEIKRLAESVVRDVE